MSHAEEDAVRQVIQQYIDGTYRGDVQALRDCFHSRAVMNGYLGDQLLVGDPEPFFKNMAQGPSMEQGGAPYRGDIVFLDVAGPVASVTLKETGFGGDLAFTDYFHLIKDEGRWTIISKTFATE